MNSKQKKIEKKEHTNKEIKLNYKTTSIIRRISTILTSFFVATSLAATTSLIIFNNVNNHNISIRSQNTIFWSLISTSIIFCIFMLLILFFSWRKINFNFSKRDILREIILIFAMVIIIIIPFICYFLVNFEDNNPLDAEKTKIEIWLPIIFLSIQIIFSLFLIYWDTRAIFKFLIRAANMKERN